MTRIKIFVENSQKEMEAMVNKWLESQANVQIKQTLQDIYCDNNDYPWITLSFVYEVPQNYA